MAVSPYYNKAVELSNKYPDIKGDANQWEDVAYLPEYYSRLYSDRPYDSNVSANSYVADYELYLKQGYSQELAAIMAVFGIKPENKKSNRKNLIVIVAILLLILLLKNK